MIQVCVLKFSRKQNKDKDCQINQFLDKKNNNKSKKQKINDEI